jgi:hypothetical protein
LPEDLLLFHLADYILIEVPLSIRTETKRCQQFRKMNTCKATFVTFNVHSFSFLISSVGLYCY